MYSNIDAERARNKMTVKELSKKLGIGMRTYFTWQKTGNIPAGKLIMMANIFDCSIDYLLGRRRDR